MPTKKVFPPMEYFAFLLSGYIWRVLSKPNLEYRYCSHFFDYESGSSFSFRCREMKNPASISLAKPNIQIKPAAERKVMTMVADKTRYANRNMRQDRKVGKESI